MKHVSLHLRLTYINLVDPAGGPPEGWGQLGQTRHIIAGCTSLPFQQPVVVPGGENEVTASGNRGAIWTGSLSCVQLKVITVVFSWTLTLTTPRPRRCLRWWDNFHHVNCSISSGYNINTSPPYKKRINMIINNHNISERNNNSIEVNLTEHVSASHWIYRISWFVVSTCFNPSGNFHESIRLIIRLVPNRRWIEQKTDPFC